MHGAVLYTNIGKTNVIAFNPRTRSQTQFERGFSLAKKIAHNEEFAAALGSDGGIVWYRANASAANTGSQRILAQWYLKTDGGWEFSIARQNAPPPAQPAPVEAFEEQEAPEPPASDGGDSLEPADDSNENGPAAM
jgi:hypothetical protein